MAVQQTRVQTFRNRRLSLLQSALQERLYRQDKASAQTWDASQHQDMQDLVKVANRVVVRSRQQSAATPLGAVDGVPATALAQNCASAVVHLIYGSTRERLGAIAELSPFGHCDAGWLRVIASYYLRLWFGGKIPYIHATSATDSVFDLPADRCRLGIIGDWGTGTKAAQDVLLRVQQFRREAPDVPFILLHVGDVYYSGTQAEYARFAAQIRACFPSEPVFNLSGNHDMYAGGGAYYRCIASLNPAPYTQKTSFFVLRNRFWQFQAMDTGLHDSDPFDVSSNLTYLEPSEVAWHRQVLAQRGDRKVVLLSHHQPFSAFSAVGQDTANNDVYSNQRLLGAFENLLESVSAWFFGHEHNSVIYAPYAKVARGRCLGSSAIPADPQDGDPYKIVSADIPWNSQVKLSINDRLYAHGYAIMDLDGPQARVRYYQYPGGTGQELLFDEEF
jgi:Calcineurin-like phosphoesterase